VQRGECNGGLEQQDWQLPPARAVLLRWAQGAVVALDTNPLIAALKEGHAARVDAAIGGRTPVVPISAAKEYIKANGREGTEALRAFLVARDGRRAAAGEEATAVALRGQAASMGRSLRSIDSRIAAGCDARGCAANHEWQEVLAIPARNWLFGGGLVMGAFNEVHAAVPCPRCEETVETDVQFKYGAVVQHQYKVGDKIIWGANNVGMPGKELVVVDGEGTQCPKCGYDGDWPLYVTIERDVIRSVSAPTGEHDFVVQEWRLGNSWSRDGSDVRCPAAIPDRPGEQIDRDGSRLLLWPLALEGELGAPRQV
jgi:hypothetical protein